ncbi:MAG: hypothetical protein RLZ25_61, partial [Pseudomonadota bacterium]
HNPSEKGERLSFLMENNALEEILG